MRLNLGMDIQACIYYTLQKELLETPGCIFGFLSGRKCHRLGKVVRGLDRLGPNLAHVYADISWNGYSLKKTLAP